MQHDGGVGGCWGRLLPPISAVCHCCVLMVCVCVGLTLVMIIVIATTTIQSKFYYDSNQRYCCDW